MNKKGCAKFLGNLKALFFAFFKTGVVNRPPANGNNHPYIYTYIIMHIIYIAFINTSIGIYNIHLYSHTHTQP